MAGELEPIEGVPERLRAWVESRAAETGRPPEEVLARAVTVHRLVAEYDGPLPDPSALDALGAASGDAVRSDLVDRIDATDERVDRVADEFDEKLADVRERVVQVKREADAKADADHDHPGLRESAEAAAGLAADAERIRAETRELESRFEAGFDNYEGVLDGLTDAVDDLDGKTTTLASVLADVRTRLDEADARRARRETTAELKREANRLGVGTAACDDCGSTVRVALLDAPECPHCECQYGGVESPSGLGGFAGFLGTATLVPGSRPDPADGTTEETTAADVLGTGAGE